MIDAGQVVPTGDREALDAAMCAAEASVERRRMQGTLGRERAGRWTMNGSGSLDGRD